MDDGTTRSTPHAGEDMLTLCGCCWKQEDAMRTRPRIMGGLPGHISRRYLLNSLLKRRSVIGIILLGVNRGPSMTLLFGLGRLGV